MLKLIIKIIKIKFKYSKLLQIKMKKRGQAATEFLTTYGWMILILILVIAALGAFNIFKPNLPNKCDSADPVFCSDVKLQNDGTLYLVLSTTGTSTKIGSGYNQLDDLNSKVPNVVGSVQLYSPVSQDCSVGITGNPPLNIIEANKYDQIPAACFTLGPSYKGKRFSGQATVEYVLRETESLGSSAKHNAIVKFSGTIE